MKAMEVPVYRPTLKEMEAGLEAYVHRIEREGGRFATAGLAKIVPPAGWTPRRAGYNNRWDVTIDRPIKQHATGTRGLYRTLLVEQKPMSARNDFQALAEAEEAALPAGERLPSAAEAKADPARYEGVLSARERRFWRSITMQPPLYGADVAGTLWDEPRGGSAASSSAGGGGAPTSVSASSAPAHNTSNPAVDRWNIGRLDSLLSRTLRKHDAEIPGVSTSYLYFGMWRSIFAWHTEDMDLASVNYLHFGAPKRWYCVPPAHRARFERLARGLLPDVFRQCPEFLRHKELMISPQLLEAHAIPVVRCTQEPGEFMINFPGAYHAGFNHGWNCAESTNFATRAWVAVGARARACTCSPDSVTIQMELFLPHANPATRKVILDNLPSDSESEGDGEEEEMSDDDVSATPSASSGGVRSVSEASSRGGHHHHAASSDDDDCCARSPVRARGRPSKAALAAAAAAAKKSRSGKRKPAAAAKAKPAKAVAVVKRLKAAGGGVAKRVSPPAASMKRRMGSIILPSKQQQQQRRVSPGTSAGTTTTTSTGTGGFGFAAAAAKVANATAALLQIPGFASLRANSRTRGAPPQTRAGRPVSAPRKLSL